MQQKHKTQAIITIMLAAVFGIEVLWHKLPCSLAHRCAVVVVLALLSLLLLLFRSGSKSKETGAMYILLKILKMDVFNVVGILLSLYTLFHIGWLQDAAGNYLDTPFPFRSWRDCATLNPDFLNIMMTVESLILPFLGFRFIQTETQTEKEVPREERRIMVTGVSKLFIKGDDNAAEYVKMIHGLNEDYGKIQGWGTIFKALDFYENIDYIFLIHTKTTLLQRNEIEKIDPKCTIESLLENLKDKNGVPRNIEILKPELVVDFDEYTDSHRSIKEILPTLRNKKNQPFEDKDFVFNLSSGTANISAIFAFLAIKGNRGTFYISQDEKKPVVEQPPINVLSISEHFDEIRELLEKKLSP